jgi:AcrR family transcriptional regulator
MSDYSFEEKCMNETADTIQAQLTAARRAQILDAATQVFAAKGFSRATIHDIAQAARIADGTIYNYFANKTDLLFGLLDRLNDTERRPLSLAQAANAPYVDFFRAYLRERVEALWSNADLLRAVLPELLANPELRARYYGDVIAPTMALGEDAFRALIAHGQMRELDVPLTTRILAGAVLGLMVMQLLGDETLAERWREIPAALSALVLPGLTPEDEGAG